MQTKTQSIAQSRIRFASKGAAGFTLIEIIIAMAIFGIIVTATTAVLSNMNAAVRNVDLGDRAASIMQEMRGALATDIGCQNNLKGMTISAAKGTTNAKLTLHSPPEINIYDRNSVNMGNVLTVDPAKRPSQAVRNGGLDVTDIELKPMGQLDSTTFIAELEVSFSKTGPVGTSLGSPNLVRRIPLSVTATAGVVTGCQISGDSMMDSGVAARACDISSQGKNYIDSSGNCVPRPVNVTDVAGSPTSVTCADVSKVVGCYTKAPTGWIDPFQDRTCRPFPGSQQCSAPAASMAWGDGSNGCQCVYATGVDPGGWACMARCQVDVY